MNEYNGMKRYDHYTKQDFLNASDEHVVEGALQWLYAQINDWAKELEIVENFSQPRKLAYATSSVVKEIWNGGINQMFFNPTKELIDNAIIGLHEMGLNQLEAALVEAKSIFHEHLEQMDGFNDGSVDSFLKSFELHLFDHLDTVFTEEKDVFIKAYAAYIRSHIDEFGIEE